MIQLGGAGLPTRRVAVDCALASSLHCLQASAGPVGIFAAKSAWLFGAGRVIVVDHVEYRLDFVRRYANCEIINFREVSDVALHIKKMTDWLGADVCIDAVGCEASGSLAQTITGRWTMLQAGAATALFWAINSVRKGATCRSSASTGRPSTPSRSATR